MSPSKSRHWSLSQLWRGNEEMANKKDDDRSLPRHAKQASQWQAASRGAPRRSVVIRFAAYVFVVFIVTYGLYRTLGLPSEDTSLDSHYSPRRVPDASSGYDQPQLEKQPPRKVETTKQDPTESKESKESKEAKEPQKSQNQEKDSKKSQSQEKVVTEPPRVFNGPIRLPELGQSLRAIYEIGGAAQKNRNILFAAASLQSAATLLPMACQMAGEHTNYVHFALMGRSDVPMTELLKINGIDKSCPLIVHDARPDKSTISTESRMALSSARALYHINVYMHPQALIIDSTKVEEDYFLFGIRDQVRSTGAALIELPEKAGSRLSWLTKLDSSSLAAWNSVHFDILVHAPPSGSGNLKRLLNSLARADLSGVLTPHITIELPSTVDTHLGQFLADYRWPPAHFGSAPQPGMISLRHRIPHQKINEEESSVRFLESFWPNKPSHSHVLIMSPHTEVTPQFFHYVKYLLLHQRYSTLAERQYWNTRLFGISFAAPTTYLDGAKQFTPPKPLSKHKGDATGTSFLWQAPNSDAVLIMGDKWVELHGYVSQFLEKWHSMSTTPDLLAKKEVGKKHPSWLEYALQLSRLRGYLTLYPSQQTADTILRVHTDLYDVPEEYEGEALTEQEKQESAVSRATEAFDAGSQVDMLATLPRGGELLSIDDLPWLTWDGKEVGFERTGKDAARYKREFRRQVGQCETEPKKPLEADLYAKDLFCATKTKAQ